MTAEIVDFLQYRRQKARAENKSRRTEPGWKAHKAAAPQEAEAPLPEDALEGEDGSRGGELA